MEQHIYPNQIFYEPLKRMLNAPFPFLPYIIGKTLPSGNYSSISPRPEMNSFNCYQFEYIVSGTFYAEIDDEKYTLTAGDFICIKKSCYRKMRSKADEPAEKLHISARGSFVDGIVSAYFPADKAVVCKADVHENFQAMLDLCEKCEVCDKEFLNTLSIELLKIVHKVSDSLSESSTKSSIDCKAETIMHYIDSNLQNKFSLGDLAEMYFFSKANIVNIFKKKYGTTPMKYAQAKRIYLAKYYLTQTNIPISEIPNVVPLGDCQYFSNVFKKHTGLSPSEYREKYFGTMPN